jgi:hypothetical protein
MVSFTLRPLYPRGENPQYSLDKRLGASPSLSGPYEEQKNILSLPRIVHPEAQLLYQLRYLYFP